MNNQRFYTYATAEKGAFRLRVKFRADGQGSHASVPGGENVTETTARVAVDLSTMRRPWTRIGNQLRNAKNTFNGRPMAQ